MKLTLQLVVVVLNAQPNFPDTVEPRFNQEPDLTNCQGTREICSLYSLRSKRFRLVSEQRKTEERDSLFWPREK